MARVFVLSLPAANKYSARIIFPPPFVERLYIQRGIFLHLEAVAPSTIRQECTEVEFPIDPSFPPFTVIRNGCHVEMLPEDPWLKKAVDWARRWAKGQQRDFPINQSEVTKIIGAAELELGFPDAIRRGGCEIQLASWVDYFSDMLYWLAIFVEEEGEYIDRDVLKDIARNNPSLVKFAANIYDTLGKKERNIDRKIACNHFKLANLLHQSLTESLNQI